MSKKMMKRSLALGALMAFVITGSAMAGELTSNNTINFNEQGGIELTDNVYGGFARATDGTDATASNNTINIAGTLTGNSNSYRITAGQIIHIEKNGEGYVTLTGNNNVINIINSAKVTNFDVMYGSLVSSGAYNTNHQKTIANGNEINISGNAEVNVDIMKVAESYGGYEAEASNNIATVSDNAKVTGSIFAGTVGASSSRVSGGDGKATAINNMVTIKDCAIVDGVVKAGYSNYGFIGEGTTSMTEMSGNVINVERNAKVGSLIAANITSYSNSYTANAENNVVNIGDNVTVNVELPASDDGEPHGVYGAYIATRACTSAVAPSHTVSAEGNTVNITGGNINSNVYGAYVFAKDEKGKATMEAVADNNAVNLSGGIITGEVYGGYSAVTELEEMEVVDKFGKTKVVHVPVQVASAASNNEVNITGTVDVTGAKLYGNNGGEGTGNTLNIKGGWSGTIGSAQNFNAINITEGASVKFGDALDDNKVAINVKGATWNVDKTNTVGSASFDASSVLSIDGDVFKAKDSDNVYALNGSGELKVANGATLAIKGIDHVKYNVAEGFTSIVDGNGNKFADGAEYWKLENALMEGVWTTENGLQVEVKAKKAEDIVEDLNVSSSTAQSLANVTAAAQAAEKRGVKADAKGSGEAKAVALINVISSTPSEVAGQAYEAVSKMAEAGGNSGTAASIVKNVTGVTNDRLSFNCGHSAPHKGGHGVGLFEEGSGADIWVEYVHGKDKVEDMKSTAGASSYEGQYNGLVMGVDFKKVNKFQSGIAFNYGEGDTNSVGSVARTHSDYDFWGIGYYGNIHNDDSNVIFDIGYAKTESDVESNVLGLNYKASPETTTWTAGVKLEKLYQNDNVQIVPYTGLRFMSIDPEDYTTECASNKYQMERQNIWMVPVGLSIKQEVTNDNGWTVSPRVDLSYIWAFGDTDSEMEFSTLGTKTNVGYEVMDDGSFLGLVGIEAHKGQWVFGISYSYQKGDHSESKKWFVDVNYSF